jgi:hypothetical protein
MELLPAVLALGAVLCAAGGVGGLYFARHRTLIRRVGSFSCALHDEGGWRAGVAHFAVGRLLWWPSLSLSPRPARVWDRQDLILTGRSPLDERDDLGRPMLVVHCRHGAEEFVMIVPANACTGLVSWLESAPRRLGV